MAHTPTPWNYAELHPDGAIIKRHGTFEINTPNYDVCAVTFTGGPIRKEDDARFIVQACNSHDELLAACKAASGELMRWFIDTRPGEGPSETVVANLITAIKNAEAQ